MSEKPQKIRQPLTDLDFEIAAKSIGCEPAVIKAIAEVETGWKPGKTGFQTQRDGHVAPIILFEMHVFGRLTGHKYTASHPELSSRKWDRTKYGSSLNQHPKLQRAVELDREAALQSCSWGLFQMMGFNWKMMGYKNLQDFIDEMYENDRAHLDSFMRFIKGSNLAPALVAKDWKRIARVYNGAGYAQNAYDVKMAAAYKRWSK